MKLPNQLEPLRKELEATVKSYLKIKPSFSHDLTLWESKFGGYPYFPKTLDYPKNPQGQPLVLLAQINFSDTLLLEGFPKEGILQFYIDSHHDLYGFDDEDMTNQAHFRVLYFDKIEFDESKLITDFSFLPNIDDLETFLPFIGSFSLIFEQKHEPISGCDYRLENLIEEFADESREGLDFCDLADEYLEFYDGEEHKLGGYPFFTQDDPRMDLDEDTEPYELLFQMRSDDEADIMWGDAGVGNFFIQPSALKKLDFSRVIYYYDCC
ncbi:YwqG family protein [Crocosphaera sp. UHCC 0190]|uniref:YwqG family protein n=1 Tax=Crocosphaera sp. UHCC 0190 TaxID=3110246 RepID=UPI002B213E51|nr:YwqG family protein [Crocosphaera sp. UHCC 0190]MEA5511308.1 YwqG family protein [Crocosphaera sp. UHCC 0190]